jgi:hypothetical protein
VNIELSVVLRCGAQREVEKILKKIHGRFCVIKNEGCLDVQQIT